MRFGITILPEHRWVDAEPLWRRSEELGFDHAWTYDHLTWGGLPDSPWFGTVSTLTAAAMVTERIRLGTFVTSPNYRHPVTFLRDLLSLEDISGGRILCGIGTGGDIDSRILGGEPLTPRERVDRLTEFTELLDRLLTADHVSSDGTYFSAVDARTLPGPVQRPRTPFIMAANGPRSLRLAARYGAGWVTTGPKVDTLEEWWTALKGLGARLDDALAAQGRGRRRVRAAPQPRLLARVLPVQPGRLRGDDRPGGRPRVHRRHHPLAAAAGPLRRQRHDPGEGRRAGPAALALTAAALTARPAQVNETSATGTVVGESEPPAGSTVMPAPVAFAASPSSSTPSLARLTSGMRPALTMCPSGCCSHIS